VKTSGGFEFVYCVGQAARHRQHHRKVAAVEILDRGNAEDVGFVLRRIFEFRGHDHDTMTEFPIRLRKGFHRARHPSHVRRKGVGQ
jgi:hypothetical protein